LHEVGSRVQQRGDDLGSSSTPVTMPESSLGSLGSGTAGHVNTHLLGVHQHTQTMGAHISHTGGLLHSNATAIETNEQQVADSFGKIGSHGVVRTRPAAPAGGDSGIGATRPGKGSHRFDPYGRPGRGSGGGAGGQAPGGGNGGQDAGPSNQPPPPPPPTWGDPGFRPPNFNPNIAQDTHTHVTHGQWVDDGADGRVTGGHIQQGDVGTPHPDQANGTVGWGARPPTPTQVSDTQPNGVYKYSDSHIWFSGFGHLPKQHDNPTMFPPGLSDTQVHGIGTQAWNDPNTKFWQNNDVYGNVRPGGTFSGQGVIPPGHPNAGMPIKVNGTWGGDGSASTYYPSPKQNFPPPPPAPPSATT
jgi:hypothetical protein